MTGIWLTIWCGGGLLGLIAGRLLGNVPMGLTLALGLGPLFGLFAVQIPMGLVLALALGPVVSVFMLWMASNDVETGFSRHR